MRRGIVLSAAGFFAGGFGGGNRIPLGVVLVFPAIEIDGKVPVEANPVHFAADHDLALADGWDVVFRLAGEHATGAADARVEVDDHPPLVLGVEQVGLIACQPAAAGAVSARLLVEAVILRDVSIHPFVLREPRRLLVPLGGALAHQLAAVHRTMLLG